MAAFIREMPPAGVSNAPGQGSKKVVNEDVRLGNLGRAHPPPVPVPPSPGSLCTSCQLKSGRPKPPEHRRILMNEPQQNRPVQNPLTLVMKAASPPDYTALHQIVEHIQSLAPQQNPVVAALNKIANVHFARFVFLDPDQLAVITTYDGDFDSYINEFTNELGDVFDAILAHVANAPPLPVQTYRQEFMDYIHAHDLRCVEPFYSAYPTSTVLDIAAVSH
jgi:hypothetical protein